MIHLPSFKQSLRHAWRGAVIIFKEEQNFRLQVAVGALVVILAFLFSVRWTEFVVLLLLIGAVLCLEMVNSILERLVDTFRPRLHPAVRDIKDIMAAAVLVASAAAALIGLIIFIPYFLALFQG